MSPPQSKGNPNFSSFFPRGSPRLALRQEHRSSWAAALKLPLPSSHQACLLLLQDLLLSSPAVPSFPQASPLSCLKMAASSSEISEMQAVEEGPRPREKGLAILKAKLALPRSQLGSQMSQRPCSQAQTSWGPLWTQGSPRLGWLQKTLGPQPGPLKQLQARDLSSSPGGEAKANSALKKHARASIQTRSEQRGHCRQESNLESMASRPASQSLPPSQNPS